MPSTPNDPIDDARKELAQAHLALAAARAAAPLTQWCCQLPPAAARAATSNIENKPAGARRPPVPAGDEPHRPPRHGAHRRDDTAPHLAPAQSKPAGARHQQTIAQEAECRNKPAGARHDGAVAQEAECRIKPAGARRDGPTDDTDPAAQNKPAGARRDWQTDDDDPIAQNKAAGARRPLTERQQLAARIIGRNRGTLSAAARVGVNRHTIPRWMRLPEFADAVERERQAWNRRRAERLAMRHARRHPQPLVQGTRGDTSSPLPVFRERAG